MDLFKDRTKLICMHLRHNIAWFASKCACQFEIYNLCLSENLLDLILCGGLITLMNHIPFYNLFSTFELYFGSGRCIHLTYIWTTLIFPWHQSYLVFFLHCLQTLLRLINREPRYKSNIEKIFKKGIWFINVIYIDLQE